MPLKKVAKKSNMYSWTSHTWGVLRGECPHHCTYCYVQDMAKRFPLMKARYSGPVELVAAELQYPLGSGRTIFVEHLNDLFAYEVADSVIHAVLRACWAWSDNAFVFQSKNPARFSSFLHAKGFGMPGFPPKIILGTTIESNRHYKNVMQDAPEPEARRVAMVGLRGLRPDLPLFVTIEPILDFDVLPFVSGLEKIKPNFVNIGADSKGKNLPEPTPEKVHKLIDELRARGIEIRQKHNLARLL